MTIGSIDTTAAPRSVVEHPERAGNPRAREIAEASDAWARKHGIDEFTDETPEQGAELAATINAINAKYGIPPV